MGPFIQLALNFQESTSVASLNRCENIISVSSDLMSDSFMSTNAVSACVAALESVIVSGDFSQTSSNNQYVQALKKDCKTGNCNWGIFPSLGYCTDCTNTTEHILTSCVPDSNGGSHCNYTLPNGQLVTNYSPSGFSNIVDFSVKYSGFSGYQSSLAYQNWDISTTFGLFSVLQNISRHQSPAVASECVFYLCVQAIQSQVINNTLHESM
jgi:hypothetical protein